MKKKWLIGLISALMAVTLCFGFAACGGNDVDEAAAVKNLIGQVKTRYLDSATETFSDYEVIGQAPYEGTSYAITWTVSSDDADYADYVKVGTMDQTTKLVTIDITLGTKAVNYTLTATVTVGSVTDSISFDHVVPVTYTVAQAKELLSGYSNEQYYQVDNEVVAVAVQGYVIETGNLSSFNNIQNAYIADSADETNKSNECQVYGLELDDTFIKTADDLVTGAYIVIVGALQYYKGGPEITFYNNAGIKPYTAAYRLPDLSDTERVSRAKAALDFYPTLYTTAGAEKELSTTREGASLTWAVTSGGEYASVSGSTLKIASPLPATQQAVVLTATIKSGSVTDTKEFNIKVGPLSRTTPSTKDAPLTVEEAQEILLTLDNGDYSEKVYVQGYVTDAGSWSSSNSNWTGVNIATTKGDTAAEKQLLVYRLTADGTVLAKEESALAVGDHVTVYGYLNNYNGTYELNYKSGDNVTCVETDHVGGGEVELTKVFKPIESNPQPGTYYLAMKAQDGEYYYITGAMAATYYFATTKDYESALQVELSSSDNTNWTIKTTTGKFIEIEVGDHVNAKYKDSQTSDKYWTWDETEKIFVWQEGAKKYFLENYGDRTSISAGDYDSYVKTAWKAVLGTLEDPTDADKANALLNSLKLTTTEFTEVDETGTALPTSDLYDATVVWSVKSGNEEDYVAVENNTLKIKKLPAEGGGTVTVTLAVSVTVGKETVKKEDIEITIKKEVELSPDLHDITATYDPTKRGHSGNLDTATDKLKDISIKIDKVGGATAPNWTTSEVRVYGGDTITISVPETYYLTKITLHYTRSDGNAVTADVGTLGAYASSKAEWTGTENTVIFTIGNKSDGKTGGHIKLTSIEFEYKSPTAECTHETVTKTDAVPAECEKAGAEAYWTCNECHRMFSSETEKTDANEIFVPVVIEALGHQFTEWTDKGDGLHHTSTCDNCHTKTQEGVHDKNGEAGKCSKCGATVTGDVEEKLLATFNFGSATSDATGEYNTSNKQYTETDGDYTFTLANPSKVYEGKGGTLKLGTGSAVGSFSFTVPDNVSSVKIYVGQYSGKDVNVTINGQTHTLTKNGDNSEFDCFEIDTSVDKTVEFTTVKTSDPRARIDKIEFYGVEAAVAAAAASTQLSAPVADLPRKD